jgi:tetratricopeptide (TPR) repeat protein
LEAAAEAYREILAVAPQNAEARHLLGVVALQAGNYDLAVNHIRRAVGLKGNVAEFHSNLGVAYRSLKKLDDAIACFRRAVKLSPNHAEARHNLANALWEHGQAGEALASWRRAVALQPNYAEGWSSLAGALRQTGSVEESTACLREVVRLRPERADSYNNLAAALHEQGKLAEAIDFYRRAILCDPTFALPHNNLGNALQQQGQLAEASHCYQRAIELKPDFAQAHVGLASARNEQGDGSAAIEHYQTAIRLQPGLAEAHCNLGIVREEQGDFAAAEKCFRAAITADFRYAAAHAELAGLLSRRLPAEDMAAQQQLLADPGLSHPQRAALHFGLAQVFDARGAYAEAAEHANVANAQRAAQWKAAGQEYDPAAHSRLVDRILAEQTLEFFARASDFGVQSQRPVFVVGLPRSGTTLVEQILASHSQVFGAGELLLARDLYAAAYGSETKPEMKSLLDREGIRRAADAYLAEIERRSGTALRVVDKMPDNYLYLGFLAALFPQARFIHCRRDLRDVAVSCWMANFRDLRWANDAGHIAARFGDYRRAMDRWREVLPAPILDVSYEETVADLEGVARRLLSWCGLDWEPGCLEFQRTRRAVRTASAVQVRQPLYTTSVGRWRHYERLLPTLLNGLTRFL